MILRLTYFLLILRGLDFGAKYGKPSTRDFINKHLRNVILVSKSVNKC